MASTKLQSDLSRAKQGTIKINIINSSNNHIIGRLDHHYGDETLLLEINYADLEIDRALALELSKILFYFSTEGQLFTSEDISKFTSEDIQVFNQTIISK